MRKIEPSHQYTMSGEEMLSAIRHNTEQVTIAMKTGFGVMAMTMFQYDVSETIINDVLEAGFQAFRIKMEAYARTLDAPLEEK